MAAWSGFASAKWSTESRLQLAEANASRVEANRAAGTAAADKETDDLAFNAWFATAVLGNAQAMEIAERRFRPEFQAAFDAWIKTDPLNNPDAPPSPTYMPEYVQPEIDEAEELDRHTNELSKEGAESGETADRYVRITVFLASVLFLVGISGHFPVRIARYGLICTAVVILGTAVRASRHLALATGLTPCLRAYIARSARRRSVSSSSSGSDIATPTLALSGTGTPSSSPGSRPRHGCARRPRSPRPGPAARRREPRTRRRRHAR